MFDIQELNSLKKEGYGECMGEVLGKI